MESSSTCSYQETEIPKMPLFEKPLTPSDVGKLNRLVIPKQHAENHFPSLRNNGDDRNGSLLSFEDDHDDDGGRERTQWKFRYSYWHSSQSYVLTRGWSRFVKEKGLCAGDIVVFSRHQLDARRLFIGWRSGSKTTSSCEQTQSVRHCSCLRSSKVGEHVRDDAGMDVLEKGKIKTSGISKKLRLFGVNLECPQASEPSTSAGSPISSQGRVHQNHPYHQYYTNNYGYMEINFSGSGYIYHQE